MMDKSCKCGSKYIVNKTYDMCDECNYFRLHGKTRFEASKEKETNKPIKLYKLKQTPLKLSKKPLKRSVVRSTKATKEKRQEVLRKDRELYLYIFNTKPHQCEECGTELPDVFEDENGNVVCIGQYSHILSKGSFPEFRHNKKNINRVCPKCHDIWEFSCRENMKIYKHNQLIIQELRQSS